jgi:hypothetical protein
MWLLDVSMHRAKLQWPLHMHLCTPLLGAAPEVDGPVSAAAALRVCAWCLHGIVQHLNLNRWQFLFLLLETSWNRGRSRHHPPASTQCRHQATFSQRPSNRVQRSAEVSRGTQAAECRGQQAAPGRRTSSQNGVRTHEDVNCAASAGTSPAPAACCRAAT